MSTIRYLTPAILELERAVDHYELVSPRIAKAFLDEYFRVLDQLRAFPKSAPVLSLPVRKMVLPKYPYSILYYIKDEHIVIVSVMAQKQHPDQWKARVKKREA